MIRRDTATDEYLGIGCDQCPTAAPPAAEILAAHGLVRLGWYCSGGTHICPAHDHPAENYGTRAPAPRMGNETVAIGGMS